MKSSAFWTFGRVLRKPTKLINKIKRGLIPPAVLPSFRHLAAQSPQHLVFRYSGQSLNTEPGLDAFQLPRKVHSG